MKKGFLMMVLISAIAGPLFDGGHSMAGPSGHRELVGTVKSIYGNVVFIHTEEGTTRTYTLSEGKREGVPSLKLGDKLLLEMDEGNQIIDLHRPHRHSAVTGTIETLRPSDKMMTFRLGEGKAERFELKDPVIPKLAAVKEGTEITLEVDEQNRVMDIHLN